MTDRHKGEPHLGKWTILSFLIGTLLGSGALFQWQKQKLDKIHETTDLREKEIEQYEKIIDLTNEYINASHQYSTSHSPELNNKIVQLRSRLEIMKDDFKVLEENLAGLEGRPPRNINVDFIPPAPPTGLTAVAH